MSHSQNHTRPSQTDSLPNLRTSRSPRANPTNLKTIRCRSCRFRCSNPSLRSFRFPNLRCRRIHHSRSRYSIPNRYLIRPSLRRNRIRYLNSRSPRTWTMNSCAPCTPRSRDNPAEHIARLPFPGSRSLSRLPCGYPYSICWPSALKNHILSLTHDNHISLSARYPARKIPSRSYLPAAIAILPHFLQITTVFNPSSLLRCIYSRDSWARDMTAFHTVLT